MNAVQPENTPPKPLPPAKAPMRRWARIAWGFVVLMSGCLGILIGATATELGFATSWRLAEIASSRALTVSKVRGNLWQGFVLEGLQYRSTALKLDIQRLDLAWQPVALFFRQTLLITHLHVGQVKVMRVRPSAAPLRPPNSLALPVAVQLNSFSLAGLTVEPSAVYLYGIRANYRYYGTRHLLRLSSLSSVLGTASARLAISDRWPFVLQGRVQQQGLFNDLSFQASATSSGNLLAPLLRGTGSANGVVAHVKGQFAPFSPSPYGWLKQLDIRLGGINPHVFSPDLPNAQLNVALQVQPAANKKVVGGITLINRDAGNLAAQRLPIRSLFGEFQLTPNTLEITQLNAQLVQGNIALAGQLSPREMQLNARLTGIFLPTLHTALIQDRLDGSISLRGDVKAAEIDARFAGKRLLGELQMMFANQSKRELRVRRLMLRAGTGSLDAEGKIQLDGNAREFEAKGSLSEFDPAQLSPQWPKGKIRADWETAGRLGKPSRATLAMQIRQSILSGAPLIGQVTLEAQPEHIKNVYARLALGKNQVFVRGAWGAPRDRLLISLDVPELNLVGMGLAGRVQGELDVAGSRTAPVLKGKLSAEQLVLPNLFSARYLALDLSLPAEAKAPFYVRCSAGKIQFPSAVVTMLNFAAEGSRLQHRLRLESSVQTNKDSWHVMLNARGGLDSHTLRWRGVLDQINLSGLVPVALLSPTALDISPERVVLGATRAQVMGGMLVSSGLTHRWDGETITQGTLNHFTLTPILAQVARQVTQDIVLNAAWSIRWGSNPVGKITVQRVGGDVFFPAEPGAAANTLGIRDLAAYLDINKQQIDFNMLLDSAYGTLRGRGNVVRAYGFGARSPLSAAIQFKLAELTPFASYAGASFDIAGQVAANVAVRGMLGTPYFDGTITAHQLKLADKRTGIRLVNGTLNARVVDKRLELTQLRFADGDGEISAQGALDMKETGPDARIRVALNRFSVFDRPSRRLVVSGEAELALVKQTVSLSGQLRADRGRIELAGMGTPALSEDVVVVTRPPAEPSALSALPLTVAMSLDLGEQFRFVGRGLDVVLVGQVQLTSRPGIPPAARGQVRVVKGRYKAYGQDLDIAYGVVSFMGPLDNPQLNVRALRRFSPVGAGVEVSGTVMAPNVRLIANEPMSDKDKLAWLVLGRAASGSGTDDMAIAASAGAFLAGSLNDHIGIFDDLGMTQRSERLLANGSVSPAEQVVVIGKRLTQEFYLGYEYGIASAYQVVKFVYQLSKNWSVILKTGTETAAETRYTVRFD